MAETNARLSDESVVLQVLGLLYLIVIPVPCRAVPCRTQTVYLMWWTTAAAYGLHLVSPTVRIKRRSADLTGVELRTADDRTSPTDTIPYLSPTLVGVESFAAVARRSVALRTH